MGCECLRFLPQTAYHEVRAPSPDRLANVQQARGGYQHHPSTRKERERERGRVSRVRSLCSGSKLAFIHGPGAEDHRGDGPGLRQGAAGGGVHRGEGVANGVAKHLLLWLALPGFIVKGRFCYPGSIPHSVENRLQNNPYIEIKILQNNFWKNENISVYRMAHGKPIARH